MGSIGEILHTGKVRRLYAVPERPDRLLLVATDRISAFDQVLSPDIPDKGEILTQLSIWWFSRLADLVPNHFLSEDVPSRFAGRGMLTERLTMVPVECVARGYLTGSGWAEYQRTQSVCGIPLPAGLQDGSQLPTPIFTPAIKASEGEHDQNVDFETIVSLHGRDLANRLKDLTLALYSRAERTTRERGIILADTKFEFGVRDDGTVVLADEVLTPDSSRFWDTRLRREPASSLVRPSRLSGVEERSDEHTRLRPVTEVADRPSQLGGVELGGERGDEQAPLWRPGQPQPSFDKQFVRDWLTYESGWDPAGDAPPPPLPPNVVAATRQRYVDAYERLVGRPFARRADASRDAAARIGDMARVVVDVMPKPEILDPQGKAVTGALQRLGFDGLTVRQGKRFEIEVAGDLTSERLDEIRDAADKLLANTVIESYDIRVAE